MQVLVGNTTAEVGAEEAAARAGAAERVVADLGTGDGRFAYRLAREHPAWLVIGIDPSADAMAEVSRRAARKPAKGGLPNVLYVVATGEALPPELDGVCDEVLSILPWGRLMRDLILGNEQTLGGIRRIARAGATFRLVLNTEIFEHPVPLDVRDLPEATPEYAREALAPRYARCGLELRELRYLTREEVRSLHSTWSRKLAHGREPRFLLLAGDAA